MKWGLAACCVFAVTGFSAHMKVPELRRPDPERAVAPSVARPPENEQRAAADPLPEPERAKDEPNTTSAVDGTIEEVEVDGDLPVYVVRGAANVVAPRVFLTGSCTTPLTYLRAFRKAAAEHGGVVALQGDKPCRDGTRRWSPDTVATAARIDAALRAAGIEQPGEITLLGYSQGAERAEWLAHRFPARFTRFVLMAGPIVPSANRFSGAHAVATLAGYGDVRENMADGAKRLKRASIPAIYMEIPGGTHHGELSLAADDIVARAIEWIDANATAAGSSPPPRLRGARAKHARGH